jgi:large subunit ribosomal protein L18
MAKLTQRKAIRIRVHKRIRKTVIGRPERPRLSINFTGQHIYAQIIDDAVGKTLVSVMTTEKSLEGSNMLPNLKGATEVGKLIAERAQAKKITQVVFDRGGFRYHGKVKALAEAARTGGLEF